MSTKKLERLRALCQADARNPFAWYTLAMEEKKADLSAALSTFARLQAEHPKYVPTYYQHAKALEEAGDLEKAKATYQLGLAAAQAAGDTHAYSELAAALDLL